MTTHKTDWANGDDVPPSVLNAWATDINQANTDIPTKAPLASPAFTGTPTGVTKTHVGLGNVDNTSDVNKPVSTAQQTALNLKAPLASPAFTGTPTGITKSHVGLGNVDNVKSDITLPSSVTTRSRPNAYRPDRNAYNFKGSNTRKLRASLAKAAQGSVQHWVVIGDSIPAGYMGDGASPIIDATKAWPRIMRSHIAAQGIPVGGTGFVPTSDTQVAFDSRWSVTGTWSVNTSGYMSTVQNGATATFVSDTAGTQVDVYYYGTGGAFTVNIDGLGAVTPTAGATLIPMKYTVTGLANTTHTVVITASNTTARYITGASVTGASGLVVSNLALSGSTSAQWADSTTVGFPNNARVGALAVSSITPDVVFLELGGNDHLQSVSSAAFKASMTTLRTQFSSSDVILVAIPSWTYMLDDHYDLADSLDVPLIDWFDRYGGGGSGQPLNNNGLITDTLNIHPNQAWHLDAGRNIGSLVTS